MRRDPEQLPLMKLRVRRFLTQQHLAGCAWRDGNNGKKLGSWAIDSEAESGAIQATAGNSANYF